MSMLAEETETQQIDQLEEGAVVDEQKTTTTTTTEGGVQPNDDLRAAVADLAKHVKTVTTPKEPTRQPTQDEIDEAWGVWKPEKENKDFFRQFLRLNTDMDPAEVEKAVKEFQPIFGAMQKGLVKQALVGARNLFQQEIAKLREEFSPALEYTQKGRVNDMQTRFYGEFPGLDAKNEGGKRRYEKIVLAVANELANKEFASETEYFKALAEGAAKEIKELVPDFDLGSRQETKQKPGTAPRLPRTSVGGTGGVVAKVAALAEQSDNDIDSLSM